MKSIALGLLALLMAAACGLFMCEVFGPEHVVAQAAPVGGSNDIAPDEPQNEPTVVNVSVWVIEVGKVDTSSGVFTADFYLTLFSDEPMGPQRLEFMNAVDTSIDEYLDEPTRKEYRVHATLASDLDLSRYPFDRQRLTIELEDQQATEETQLYRADVDESGLDPTVAVPGWTLDDWQVYLTESAYPSGGEDVYYTRYNFVILVHRPVGSGILKTVLPALIIVGAGLLSLLLSPDKGLQRLALATGAFIPAVLFHINQTASLPPLGYLTMADRFMVVNYFALMLTILSTLIILYYMDKGRTAAAYRVHKVAQIVIPVLWVGLLVLNFLL